MTCAEGTQNSMASDDNKLLQRQNEGRHTALTDDVYFLRDSLLDAGSVVSACMRAMQLCCTDARSDLTESGEYHNLVSSLCNISWTQFDRATETSGAKLAVAYILVAHVANEGPRSEQNGEDQVTAHLMCQALVRILSTRAYKAANIEAKFAKAMNAAQTSSKISKYLPAAFINSPQAVALMAVRLAVDCAALTEGMQSAADSSGLLRVLVSVFGETVAVLTGRARATFTDRANSCIWYATSACSSLERLCIAHASNCAALLAEKAPFGPSRCTTVPAVATASLAFAKHRQLLHNKASALFISSALHLLMNLTHGSSTGVGAALACGAPEALATIFVNTCTSASTPEAQSREGSPAPLSATEPRRVTRSASGRGGNADSAVRRDLLPASQTLLPDSQDFLDALAPPQVTTTSAADDPTGDVPVTPAALVVEVASEHTDLLSSALCVLVNLAERSEAAARRVAALEYEAQQGCKVPGWTSAPPSAPSSPVKRQKARGGPAVPSHSLLSTTAAALPAATCPSSSEPQQQAGAADPVAGTAASMAGRADAAEPSVTGAGRARLAAGSRRRRRGGLAAQAPSSSAIESQPLEAAATSVDKTAAAQSSLNVDSAVSSKTDMPAPAKHGAPTSVKQNDAASAQQQMQCVVERALAARQGVLSQRSFVASMCSSLHSLWEWSDRGTGPSDRESLSELTYVELYIAILIGLLAHHCPELKSDISRRLDTKRMAETMSRGLEFYSRHGAIEDDSASSLKAAITSLV